MRVALLVFGYTDAALLQQRNVTQFGRKIW
jgi:hypothetical protein